MTDQRDDKPRPAAEATGAVPIGRPGGRQHAQARRWLRLPWLRLPLRKRWYAALGAGTAVVLAGALTIAWPDHAPPRAQGGCGLVTCTATVPSGGTARASTRTGRRADASTSPNRPASAAPSAASAAPRPAPAPSPSASAPSPSASASQAWPPGHGRGHTHHPHATPTP